MTVLSPKRRPLNARQEIKTTFFQAKRSVVLISISQVNLSRDKHSPSISRAGSSPPPLAYLFLPMHDHQDPNFVLNHSEKCKVWAFLNKRISVFVPGYGTIQYKCNICTVQSKFEPIPKVTNVAKYCKFQVSNKEPSFLHAPPVLLHLRYW